MKAAQNLFVSIDYSLSLDSGDQVDSSPEGEPLGFVLGAGQIIPGLEKALVGKAAGDEARITLEPEDAYGPVQDDLFQNIPKAKFPEGVEVKPGAAFQAQGPRGPMMITVSAVNDDETVTIDLNHPMAGKRLVFDVKVVEVREAKEEELTRLSSGCACGPEGQQDCGSDCGCG